MQFAGTTSAEDEEAESRVGRRDSVLVLPGITGGGELRRDH
jgi:hypothetical protein